MKPRYYLNKLIKNGHYWQYTDVQGNGKKPKWFFLPAQWIMIIISVVVCVCFLDNGFGQEFVGYTNATLAILTGLYLTVVISLFDKFDKNGFVAHGLTEQQKNNLKIKKNFFIQFTSLAAYFIIISLFCLGLLSLTLLFEYLNVNTSFCVLIKEWRDARYCCFASLIAIISYRIILLYFLMDIIYLSCYIISSAYSFIVGEYDRVKIDK